MPDPAADPSQVLAAISRETVKALKEHYGKGPNKAKSYWVDDLLFVVLRDGQTIAEQTMVKAGNEDLARQARQAVADEMAEGLTRKVEELTGRKVLACQSQMTFEPDVMVKYFIFEDQLPSETGKRQISSSEIPPNALP